MRYIVRFRRILDDFSHGCYMDPSEPLKLSFIDLDCVVRDDGEQLNSRFLDFPRLRHLNDDMNRELNSAYIEEHSALVRLKADYAKCVHKSLKYKHYSGGMSLCQSISGDNDFGIYLESSDVSSPGTHDYTDAMQNDDIFINENMQRLLLKALQNTYSSSKELLDHKLHTLEVMHGILDFYLDGLVSAAMECDIQDARPRGLLLVSPLRSRLESHRFYLTDELKSIQEDVIVLTSDIYFNGNKDLAARRLESRYLGSFSPEKWFVHMKVGAGAAFLLWTISETITNDRMGADIWHDPTFAIFNCLGDLLLTLWLWGVSISVWRAAGIDFIRLLRLEGTALAASSSPETVVYSAAADVSLVYLVAFVAFNKAHRGVFSLTGKPAVAHTLASCLFLFLCYRFFFPWKSRKIWFRMLWNVLTAPMSPVSFRDSYIGDLLTSLVRVFGNILFSVVYVLVVMRALLMNDIVTLGSSDIGKWMELSVIQKAVLPAIALFPLCIRLLQCLRRSVETGKRWPHLANACKYLSAMAVAVYGIKRVHGDGRPVQSGLLGFVATTLFQLFWDLVMDWGLLMWDSESSTGVVLRPRRLLGPTWIYITAITVNTLLRFTWTLTLLPESLANESTTIYRFLFTYLSPLITAAEIMRRMMWGFLRLEWEQLERLGNPQIKDDIDSMDSLEKMGVHTDTHASARSSSVSFLHNVGVNGTLLHEWEWIPYIPGLHATLLDITYSVYDYRKHFTRVSDVQYPGLRGARE
eukprot:gene5930-11964_t